MPVTAFIRGLPIISCWHTKYPPPCNGYLHLLEALFEREATRTVTPSVYLKPCVCIFIARPFSDLVSLLKMEHVRSRCRFRLLVCKLSLKKHVCTCVCEEERFVIIGLQRDLPLGAASMQVTLAKEGLIFSCPSSQVQWTLLV